MIMELPKRFYLPFAEVTKDGQLIMEQVIRYEDLMYELTYALRRRRCIYCDKRLNYKNSTMDHRYPRVTGGISIVNNLFPACPQCNSGKGDLTHKEYLKLKEIANSEERKIYLQEIKEQKEKNLHRIGYILPNKWVEFMDVADIQYRMPDYNLRGKKYYRILEFYNKYKQLPRPIVVDKENKLLDGYNIILFSNDFNIQYIPVIKLENVIVIKH